MFKKIKYYLFEKSLIEYILLAVFIACVVGSIFLINTQQAASYFQKPVSEMKIGDLILILFFMFGLFSGRKRS